MVQHPTCFWVIFSMQYAEHITENESLQHTYVQSSFCFRLIFFVTLKGRLDWSMIVLLLGAVRNSVRSLQINHSSISGEADKPVRNKPKAKDRTLYKLAYELLCIPQTQWIQENRQVFITIFMHRIKHLLQTENSIFFSSFLGCHLKLKTEKTLVSEILTINSPNNDLHYVTKAQWILEFPFVQIHPSIGFLIKNHLVWQDQAFPNVHKLTPQERLHLLDRLTISFVEWQRGLTVYTKRVHTAA